MGVDAKYIATSSDPSDYQGASTPYESVPVWFSNFDEYQEEFLRLNPDQEDKLPKFDTLQDLVAYCARVSNPSNQMNEETSEKLIKYLN